MASVVVKCFHSDIELLVITSMPNEEFRKRFPGRKGLAYDGCSKWVGHDGSGAWLPVQRRVEYKKKPSLHKCDDDCLSANLGSICECACGGKNHGLGMFTGLVAH